MVAGGAKGRRGLSMVEVMIAMSVLAFVLLAFLSVIQSSATLSASSRESSIAAFQLQAALESTFALPYDDFLTIYDPAAVPEVCVTFQDLVHRLAGDFTVHAVERFAFYEMAKKAAYIVATTEFRLYGNIILKKGVVHPHEVFRV